MRKFSFFIFTFLLLQHVPVSSAEIHSLLTTKKVFDNGLTLLVTEMPTNEMVSVYGLVLAGSATEGKYLGAGTSHFLEHMTFKTTQNRLVGQVAADIQAVGGSINATTSMDKTMYIITVPAEAVETAIDVLADQLFNMTLEMEEFEKEREVIINEMRLHNDNPERKILKMTFENIYRVHPYGQPVIGHESLFKKVTKENLMEYYKTNYVPNNIIVSIAGNISVENVILLVEEKFSKIPRGRPVVRLLPDEPEQLTSRFTEKSYNTSLTRMSMSFPSVSLLNKDLYALNVLAMIVGQGRTSRLFNVLYKDLQLVQDVSAWNYTPIDKGFFVVNMDLERKNTDQVVELVLNEVTKIKKNGVSQNELDKAKRLVLSEHVMGQQTTGSVAYRKAVDQAFTGDYRFSEMYVENIAKVTKTDVKRVAWEYLMDSRLNISILFPESKVNDKLVIARKIKTVSIQKITLSNGMRVLLRNDPTFPLVSVRLTMQGGTRIENKALNGISEMFSTAWMRGSKGYAVDKLDELIETHGMNLSSYAGRNSVGINMDFLRDDWETGMKVLFDIVKQPVFETDELEKVRSDMLTILKRQKDSIFQYSSQLMREQLFKNHAFSLNIFGSEESIKEITRENLQKYHSKILVPENMVLAVFGDISTNEFLKYVENSFGSLKGSEFTIRKSEPVRITEKILFNDNMKKEQAMTLFGFQAENLYHKDRYGLEVMAAILGASFNGRLFVNIRDKEGKAYTLGGGYFPGLDTGMVYFYVLSAPEHVEDVKKLVEAEIDRLQIEDVQRNELDEIKMYLKGSFKSSLQTNADLALTTALDELYGLGYEAYKEYDASIDSVTSNQIRTLANQYLNLDHSVIVVVEPFFEYFS